MHHVRIHVDLSGDHNTGLAIANPLDSAVAIQVKAFESDGVTPAGTAGGIIDLPGKGHMSRFANELVSGLPAGFIGVLDISSENEFTADFIVVNPGNPSEAILSIYGDENLSLDRVLN